MSCLTTPHVCNICLTLNCSPISNRTIRSQGHGSCVTCRREPLPRWCPHWSQNCRPCHLHQTAARQGTRPSPDGPNSATKWKSPTPSIPWLTTTPSTCSSSCTVSNTEPPAPVVSLSGLLPYLTKSVRHATRSSSWVDPTLGVPSTPLQKPPPAEYAVWTD